MEEDEEIVLQNSPLDTYLQEVTEGDFSRYQGTKENLSEIILENSFESNSQTINGCSTKEMFHSPGRLKLNTICNALFESQLLNHEDLSLLLDIKDEVSAIKQEIQDSEWNIKKQPVTPVIATRYFLAALCILLLSIAIFQMNVMFRNWYYTFVPILFVGFVWYYYVNYQDERTPDKPQITIKNFISLFHEIDKLLDKSINHIKEVEIINSGFHIYRNKITGGEISGAGKTGKCLKLRNTMLDMLIELFMELRVNLRMMLQSYSDELFSVKEEYLASIPLTKFNDLIAEKRDTETLQLSSVSLDKLKAMVYLFRALLSEFTLALIVGFHQSSEAKEDCVDLYNAMVQINTVTKPHVVELKKHLQKSIHLIFKQTNDTVVRPLSQESPTEKHFGTCKVNLFSALKRVEESELLIKRNTSVDINLLENLVLQFYMNLDNAKSCVEDILDIYKPEKKNTSPTIDKAQSSNDNDTKDDINVSMVIPEREMGDLMFEGESLKVHSSTKESVDLEELQQQLKEKRESKRLLRELKCIFAVKESPAGLLSFPLAKTNENIEEEIEEVDIDIVLMNKKPVITAACDENEDFYGEGEENPELLNYLPSAPIGLPASLLQGLPAFAAHQQQQNEEKFGSSDDSQDEN